MAMFRVMAVFASFAALEIGGALSPSAQTVVIDNGAGKDSRIEMVSGERHVALHAKADRFAISSNGAEVVFSKPFIFCSKKRFKNNSTTGSSFAMINKKTTSILFA